MRCWPIWRSRWRLRQSETLGKAGLFSVFFPSISRLYGLRFVKLGWVNNIALLHEVSDENAFAVAAFFACR